MSLAEIIPWRGKRDPITEELAAAIEASPTLPPSLLDRAASATDAVLKQAHEEVGIADRIIADAQERRRQALIIIGAFEPAQKQIEEGIDPPARKSKALKRLEA
jgi:hypothetical protein